jgi:UDP-galactopyranose mutase
MNFHSISFERVEEFKHLGTTITNQYSIQEEIKSRLQSGNASCHSIQNLLSSSFLFKNLKINYTELKCCQLFCMGVKLVC